MDQLRSASPRGGCPLVAASPSPSPSSPLLPLQAYLMDKNDHERRLVRLSGCLSSPLDAASAEFNKEPECHGRESGGLESDGLLGSISPFWDFVERDETPKQEPSSRPATTHEESAEAAEASEPVVHGHRNMSRSASASISPSASSLLSPPIGASAISDPIVGAPPAVRHLSLHRELQQAGLGGLETSFHSRIRYHR